MLLNEICLDRQLLLYLYFPNLESHVLRWARPLIELAAVGACPLKCNLRAVSAICTAVLFLLRLFARRGALVLQLSCSSTTFMFFYKASTPG